MARKSSFLQGFEVGADLYNRGFSQAQSMAEMKLRQDAQGLQKKKMEAELRAIARAEEEAKRKLKTKNDAYGSLGSFMELQKEWGWNYSKPDDVRDMTNMLYDSYYSDIAKDPEAKQNLQSWLDGISQTEGGKLIELSDIKKRAEIQFKAQQNIKRKDAEVEEIKAFNAEHKTNYSDIKDVRYWKPRLKQQLDIAKTTGQFDSMAFADFEGYESFYEFVNAEAARKVEADKMVDRSKDAEVDREARALGVKNLFEQKRDFDSTAREMGQPGLDFNSPSDRAKVTAYTQFKPIQDEAAAVGTAGLAILNSIKPGPDGVYSQKDLLSARAQIAELKQDMDEIPELKKNLNDAYGKLRADGSIKQYQLASGQLDQMREVKDLGTAAADIGMIFMFMKALDPTSVVRENEQATAQNATGVPDRIRNLYNNILSGNRLNATQRAEFFEAAEGSVTGLQKKAINVIDSFSDQFETVYGKPHNFTPIRELVGLPKLVFSSQKDYEANKGNIQPGQEFIIKNDNGSITTGTGPKKTSEASSQNERPLEGETREEIQNLINAGKAEGRYVPGQEVSVIDPKTGKQVTLTVPGDMDQPDPAPNQMAPTGTPEGQPAPRQLPEVENDAARGQTDMQSDQAPQPDEELERAPSETGQPVGIEPEMPMVVGDEFRTSGEITEDQLQESEVMREFQDLASNGGGENPYAFRRHRVKIGNTTGEIVRTNSRGVFIKIPNGPTRFMSWGALSRRIESGDFKPNKARLNQQLKGE